MGAALVGRGLLSARPYLDNAYPSLCRSEADSWMHLTRFGQVSGEIPGQLVSYLGAVMAYLSTISGCFQIILLLMNNYFTSSDEIVLR